jgi:hypothetical protein
MNGTECSGVGRDSFCQTSENESFQSTGSGNAANVNVTVGIITKRGGIATVFGKPFYCAPISKAPGNGHYLQKVQRLLAESVVMVVLTITLLEPIYLCYSSRISFLVKAL